MVFLKLLSFEFCIIIAWKCVDTAGMKKIIEKKINAREIQVVGLY